jgi:ribosomal protein S18 acetylase RimI-like enzyme
VQEFVPLATATPTFTTDIATTEDDKVEVLHLIAESVAQQRRHASMAIICHPLSLISAFLILATLYRRFLMGHSSAWAVSISLIGLLMAALGGIRLLTMGYIHEAESIGTWSWLESNSLGSTEVVGQDEMFLTRAGPKDTPIGALILRGIRDLPSARDSPHSGNGNGQRKRRQNSKDKNAPIIGQIRGWTVQPKYRRQGIGTELLEEAIRLCQERGWQGPEIDPGHANSKRHLPKFFAKPFEKRDAQARRLLERTKEDMGVDFLSAGAGKRRR